MGPLVGFAISLLPSLAKRIADRVLPDVEEKITGKIRDVLGTSDPEEVAEKVKDPEVQTELTIRLAEIEAEAEKQERKIQLETLRTELKKEEIKDTASARDLLKSLSAHGSVIAWAPAVVSVIVVLGFFTIIGMLMYSEPPEGANQQHTQLIYQILNITIGALTAGFATVVSFWLGSSQGSRNKDLGALTSQSLTADLQRENANATKELLDRQSRQTEAIINKVGPGPTGFQPSAKRLGKSTRQFHRCMDIILRHEGGFSDHPDDPGGPTKFGITHKTLAAWRKVDACTRDDVERLTLDEAKEIYRAQYWNALNCDQLPSGIDLVTFDFGVNAGVNRAARMLQGVVSVKSDGQIGPITIGAAQQVDSAHVISEFSEARLEFYKSLSHWNSFGRGWTRRTTEVRESAQEMARETLA